MTDGRVTGPLVRKNSTSKAQRGTDLSASGDSQVPRGGTVGLARGLVGEHTRKTGWCKGGEPELSGRASGESVKVREQGSVIGVLPVSAGARGLGVRGSLFR